MDSTILDGASRFVDGSGVVHLREWEGEGDRNVLCLHAVGGSHAHWLGVAPRLAEHGRVLAPDLAGHGLTPRGPDGAGIEAQRALVARVLADTGRSIVVGSSFGGGVAILQQARQPESIKAMILSGSLLPPYRAGDPPEPAFAPYLRHRLRQRLRGLFRRRSLSLDRQTLLAEGLRNVAANPASLDPALVEAIVASEPDRPTRELFSVMAEAGRSTFRLLSRPHAFARILDRVSCPVLLLHGRRDRTIPYGFAVAAAQLHPNWTLHVFEDLGHLPHLEDPDAWLAVVAPWLDDVDSA